MKPHALTTNTSRMLVLLLVSAICSWTYSAEPSDQTRRARKTPRKPEAASYGSSVPKPTLAGVRYGDHERHILDFWQAESAAPTPLVFVIHGGGWQNGEKERLHRFVDVNALLAEGISVVALNYRHQA